VRAPNNVTFSVPAGEVHGLVGENGAGKFAFMAVASGALVLDSGRVAIIGEQTLVDTEPARRLGLAIVRQEPALIPDLTVSEKLYLGVPAGQRPSLMSTSERSVTNRLSFAFSSSSCLMRLTSEGDSSPNFVRQLWNVASLMHILRQTSDTGVPSSASFSAHAICSSVHLLHVTA
jgi:ABC-type sugar transport system ATPase subunit